MHSRSDGKGVLWRGFALALSLCCLWASEGAAQERYWGALNFEVSRETLEQALSRFDGAVRSQAYSPELRARAGAHATSIRARLQEGDFRVGDQFMLVVEGDSILTDTFVVGVGRQVHLPNIGAIPLEGVLRSELQAHITERLEPFLADPVIRARPLIRIAVLGGVDQPGYYRVPIETPITDVIMLVGGPAERAELEEAHVDRYGNRIWLGPALGRALREGETLDEIKMLPGDEVIIPQRPAVPITQLLGILGTASGLIFTFLNLN